ncbi:MAG: hypothetical protein K2G89_11510, partial [Lachnospiraceae bacterium]|nr:hypothetical protein [Lachnospiraceae bacterium]
MEEKNRQPEVTIEGNTPAGKKKKKLGVWIIDIIIIAVLAVAVAYAVNRDRHKHQDVVQKEMLHYLEKRYGEEFELVEDSYRGTDYAHSFVSAEA